MTTILSETTLFEMLVAPCIIGIATGISTCVGIFLTEKIKQRPKIKPTNINFATKRERLNLFRTAFLLYRPSSIIGWVIRLIFFTTLSWTLVAAGFVLQRRVVDGPFPSEIDPIIILLLALSGLGCGVFWWIARVADNFQKRRKK